ncbi:MAG: 50S ribosomal protein L10 [bacterium]
MAYTRERKGREVELLKRSIESSEVFILADPIGLSVSQSNELRRKIRKEGGSMRVYKNTLIRRVLADEGNGRFEALMRDIDGPTALVFSADPISVSKVLTDFAKENEALRVKSGYYAGDVLTREHVQKLSKLGSREEVIGKLILALKAPVYRLAGALKSPAAKLTFVLKAVGEKESK